MAKKRSNILILFLILFGSSGISFLFNISIENINNSPTTTREGEDSIIPTTSAWMNNIVMDGVINDAEWANATHVAKFYLNINNSGTPANVDGYNYMYVGEDTENMYIGLDLCGDQTGDINEEWISVFLNTNESTFNGHLEWDKALNNGAESLIHNVQNNRTWDFFTETISESDTKSYYDENITCDYGVIEGSESGLASSYDLNYFNVSSVQNNTRYVTWTNFEFNISEVYPIVSEEFFKAISHFQFRLYSKNNISVDSQKIVFWYNNGTYNLTDTSHVFDIYNGTDITNEFFDFYVGNILPLEDDDTPPESWITGALLLILIVFFGIVAVFGILYKVITDKMQRFSEKFKEGTKKFSKRLRPEKGSEREKSPDTFKPKTRNLSVSFKRKEAPILSTQEIQLVAAKPKSIPTPDHKPAAKPTPKTEVKSKPKTETESKLESKPTAKPAMDEETLQKKYKEGTGKNAIWRGAETKAYQDWKEDELNK